MLLLLFDYLPFGSSSTLNMSEKSILKQGKSEVFDLIKGLADIGVWVYHVEKDLLEWDKHMFEIFGVDPETFAGKFEDWRKMVHPDDVNNAEEAFMASVRSKGTFTHTFRVVGPKGEVKHIKANAKEIATDDPRETIIVGANQDITNLVEMKRDQEELMETLRDSQVTAKIGSWQYYPETQESKIDEVTRQIYGVGLNEPFEAAEGIQYYKEGWSRQTIIAAFEALLADQKPYDLELQMINAQGQELWVRTIGKAQADENGNTIKTYGVFQDITSQKRREHELEETTRLFQGAFNYSAIGMALIDRDDQLMRVNRKMCEYFGYTEEEMVGRPFLELVHAKDLTSSQAYLKEALDGKRDYFFIDQRFVRKDGSTFWVYLSEALIRDASGEPLYFVAQLEDIQERKVYEKKLEVANKEMHTLTEHLTLQNRSLSDYAHIASHNLRAPLANLILLKDLYTAKPDEAFRASVFSKMSKSIDQLNQTLDDLVNALVIKSNSGLDKEECSLSERLENARKQLNDLLDDADAEIATEFEFDQLYGQPVYIESIFMNLLSNALKYRQPDRQLKIVVKSFYQDDQAIIAIKDNGQGIDLKRYGDQVFGLYKTFHRNSDARGVGLYLVKMQTEALGGSVEVQSEVGQGSTFSLHFNKSLVDG